jgi:diguanylate cyclase (GGDEF)-like protein
MDRLHEHFFQSPVPDYHLSLDEQQAILDIQHSILEMVVSNRPDQEVFAELCLMAENLLSNAVASIMMKQPEGYMDVLCAPSVPPAGQELLNGLVPSPVGGSCGNAVFCNEPIFVIDAAKDDRCGDTRDVFKEFGLSACWSTPIRDTEGRSIGSFALSSFEIRKPGSFHKQLLAIAAHMVGIILQRSEQQKKLEFMAFNDPLTGLANRTSLFSQIEAAIHTSRANMSSFSLLFLDLDRFKNLNDTFGHTVGDEVLTIISNRLKETLGQRAVLSRVGGDEFVVLIQDDSEAAHIASLITTSLKQPIIYRSHSFKIDCSMGVASYPADGDTAEELLKNADTAMYHAKKRGGNKASFYEPALSKKAEQAFNIEHDLHNALLNNEFQLVYQTQIDCQTNKPIGVEALIRWHSPDSGLVSPADFIPIAEETGLIVPIGEWVVQEALQQMEPIFHSIDTDSLLNLSINVSGAQLNGEHVDSILALINQSAIPNHCIELEITETFLVQEAESSAVQLNKIREAGVKLAIDDFGIGYSSLAYLKRFKVNTLKIDRMLINDINTDADDRAISQAVIALGHSLGLQVVAEGVETAEQAESLKQMGCDIWQGFYFSKPVPLDSLRLKAL